VMFRRLDSIYVFLCIALSVKCSKTYCRHTCTNCWK
jgi:hypothetical protein